MLEVLVLLKEFQRRWPWNLSTISPVHMLCAQGNWVQPIYTWNDKRVGPINSLPLSDLNEILGRYFWNLVIDRSGISCEIAFRWMSLDFTHDKSTLVQVMAWRRQATLHYLSQSWPRSLSPYGMTGPQCIQYAHGFVFFVLLWLTSVTMDWGNVFTHILQGYFTGTDAIVSCPNASHATLKNMGQIDQYQNTTKHKICVNDYGFKCILKNQLYQK